MSGTLHGYRATGAEGFGERIRVGGTLRRERGLHLARTLRDALVERSRGEYGSGWPLRLFVLSADRGDLLAENSAGITARALRVERELPLSDAFGARADELVALVEGLSQIRWVRPTGAVLDARIGELVTEHQAALADYEPVTSAPTRIVRTWHEARDLYGEIMPYELVICTSAAVRSAGFVLEGTTDEGAFRFIQPVAVSGSYPGAWDALWRAAGMGAATGLLAAPMLDVGDPHEALVTAARSVEALTVALGAARDPARSAGWDIALNIFTNAPGDPPQASLRFEQAERAALRAVADRQPFRRLHAGPCATCAALPAMRDRIVGDFIHDTAVFVGRLAVMAARHAWWEAAFLIRQVPRRDPFRPLLDLWLLGACPLGLLGKSYVVLLPEPTN